jgi:hypothetical protein
MLIRAEATGIVEPKTFAIALKLDVDVFTNEITSPTLSCKITTPELCVIRSSGESEKEPEAEPKCGTPLIARAKDQAGTGAGNGGDNAPSTPQLRA